MNVNITNRDINVVFATLLAVIVALTSLLITGLVSPFNKPISPPTAQPEPITMALVEADLKYSPYDDDDGHSSTTLPAFTPPSTIVDDVLDDHHTITDVFNSSLVPWPGSTFLIRSVASGEVITLLDGNVVLTRPGGRGSSHWACIENKGWLGFQNIVSGKFLGHDPHGTLRCTAEHHQMWEYFCARVRPDGGCVLLMTHWERLWHVGIKSEIGMKKLAKIGDGGTGGIDWEFIRV